MTRKSSEQFERKERKTLFNNFVIGCVLFGILCIILYYFIVPNKQFATYKREKSQSFQCLEEKNVMTKDIVIYNSSWENASSYIGKRLEIVGQIWNMANLSEIVYTSDVNQLTCTLRCTPDNKTCQWLDNGNVVKEGKDCRYENKTIPLFDYCEFYIELSCYTDVPQTFKMKFNTPNNMGVPRQAIILEDDSCKDGITILDENCHQIGEYITNKTEFTCSHYSEVGG